MSELTRCPACDGGGGEWRIDNGSHYRIACQECKGTGLSPESAETNAESVGVRRIIGDPLGRLMQDEVADRIQKLVNVLRATVGIMDALKLIDTLPGMTPPERKAVVMCRDQIREMLDEQMPEWDAVCKAIHEANVRHEPRGGQGSD